MNTPTLNRPPFAYEPGRTLTAAIAVSIVLEAGLGLLLLGRHPQQIVQPIAPLRVTHVVTIADAPTLPAPPVTPPARRELARSVPAKPRPTPTPPKAPTPREPQPAAPAPTTNAAPAVAPPPAQPTAAAPPSAARPSANYANVRRGVVPLSRVEPDYPKRALADNIEGSVTADLTIEEDGHVSNVRIVRAQPPGIFEREAEKALRQWKFSASDSGIVGEVELNFTLN